jgi:activator of HSP90 ATPase
MTLQPSDRLVCVRNSVMMRTCAMHIRLAHQQEHSNWTCVLQASMHYEDTYSAAMAKSAGAAEVAAACR